jgi:hypothetical protein
MKRQISFFQAKGLIPWIFGVLAPGKAHTLNLSTAEK